MTHCQVEYPGSIGIDEEMLKAANILPYEKVLLANATNGARLETYAIPAPAGSREIKVLGAAAKLFDPGDVIIIMNFGFYSPEEMQTLKPTVIVCDEKNNFEPLKK